MTGVSLFVINGLRNSTQINETEEYDEELEKLFIWLVMKNSLLNWTKFNAIFYSYMNKSQ